MLNSSQNLVPREDFFLPKGLIYALPYNRNEKQMTLCITLHNWLDSYKGQI